MPDLPNNFIEQVLSRLQKSFPETRLLANGEVLVHTKGNQYFNLYECTSWTEVNCKVLEYLTRGAFKTLVYKTDANNDKFHKFMLDGINRFLETDFSEEEVEFIYTYLGNGCHRKLAEEFVENGFDMNLLYAYAESKKNKNVLTI